MRFFVFILACGLAVATAKAGPKKPAYIQWKATDCSSPLMLPESGYSVSKFGKGQYRIDYFEFSKGHFNNIYIIFQATNSLSPEVVADAKESSFMVNNSKISWRSYKTVVEGRSVIRKEALLPNTLPHEKKDADSDFIWMRIDADSQKILDELTPVAEAIIQDAAKPESPQKSPEPKK
jgi:hypothetical protein